MKTKSLLLAGLLATMLFTPTVKAGDTWGTVGKILVGTEVLRGFGGPDITGGILGGVFGGGHRHPRGCYPQYPQGGYGYPQGGYGYPRQNVTIYNNGMSQYDAIRLRGETGYRYNHPGTPAGHTSPGHPYYTPNYGPSQRVIIINNGRPAQRMFGR